MYTSWLLNPFSHQRPTQFSRPRFDPNVPVVSKPHRLRLHPVRAAGQSLLLTGGRGSPRTDRRQSSSHLPLLNRKLWALQQGSPPAPGQTAQAGGHAPGLPSDAALHAGSSWCRARSPGPANLLPPRPVRTRAPTAQGSLRLKLHHSREVPDSRLALPAYSMNHGYVYF